MTGNLHFPAPAAHCHNCAAPYPAALPTCPECGDRDTLPLRPLARLTVRRVSTGEVLETREWVSL